MNKKRNKELLLEISYKCNLKCIHCSSVGVDCDKKLSISQIEEILKNQLDEIEVVRISGGEPFLNNNLDEYCKFFKNGNIKVVVQTNGTCSSSSSLFNSASQFIDEFWISFYGNNYIHNFITMGNHYYTTKSFILSVIDKYPVVIQSPIFNETQLASLLHEIHRLKQEYDIVKKGGIKLRLFALLSQGRCNFALPIGEQICTYSNLFFNYKDVDITCSLDDSKCNYENKLVLKPDGSLFNCSSHKHGLKLCKK